MAVIPDFSTTMINGFITQNIAPGSTIYTDGLKSFTGLQEIGFQHIPHTQPLRTGLRRGAKSVVPNWEQNPRDLACQLPPVPQSPETYIGRARSQYFS